LDKNNRVALAQTTIRVYYEDTDLAGVVYYANYLKFFERVRTEWLRECGIENWKLLQEQKLAFVVTECNVRYLKAAKMDDLLLATVESFEATKARGRVEQVIYRDGLALCSASVAFACIDVNTAVPARLPIQLLEKARSLKAH
jgi:acyl-CoA thioester hydrolase